MNPFFLCPKTCPNSWADLDGVSVLKDLSVALGRAETKHPLQVVELLNGRVVGELKLALTQTGQALGGVQALVGNWSPKSHRALGPNLRIRRKRPGRALLLGTKEAGNYYHWMLDCVPRWKLMVEAGFMDYDYVLLNMDTLSKSFCRDILDLLGVPVAKRLHCSTIFLHEFDWLVTPSMPFPRWEVSAWACEWVSSLFNGKNAYAPERIYISRRATTNRPLTNEAELESELTAHGFKVIQPEQFSVAEQAAMFRRAKCVVAPHGAGLTNLIFAPRGTQLIELFPPHYAKPSCFYNLALANALHYSRIAGKAGKGFEYEIDVREILKAV